MPPEVSIITVYYNCPEDILALAESIRKHAPQGSYEWIVADNHSARDLSGELPEAVYIRLDNNYGFAKANNIAARQASAPFLFFVNPDCMFVENCLPALIQVMSGAGVCGPKVLNEDGTLQLSFGPFLSIQSERRQKRLMRNEKTEEVQRMIREKGETAVDYVSGCALMISTELYRRVNGFDERFFLYEEDVDLCKRVSGLGFSTLYVPSAVILHRRNRAVRVEQERSKIEYRKSQLYYYRKHHGWLQNLLLRIYLKLKTGS